MAVVGVLVAELVAVVAQVEAQLQVLQFITLVMAIGQATDLRLSDAQIYYFYQTSTLLANCYSESMAQ